jgi:hydroxyacylglutathione hydrolase
MIEIHSHELPPIGTNCWLFIDRQRQEIVVGDAPLNAFATVERLLIETGYRLTALLLTHGHWDHTLDAWRFAEFGVPIYGHAGDRPFFENPQSMSRFSIPGLPLQPVTISHWVSAGDELSLLGHTVEVRHVPGHSPGSVLYWFRDAGVALSGDALFNGSVGRTDFPGCSFAELEQSIRLSIYTLPDNTRILPGHGPETSVGDEAATNPFVRGDSPEQEIANER